MVVKNETQATYEAEWELRDMLELSQVYLHGVVVDVPIERKFGTIESIQTYVDKVLALNWVRTRYAAAVLPLKVVRTPKGGNGHQATCGGGIMMVPLSSTTRWAMREVIILHELAHHLTPYANHNVVFRSAFAHLIEEIMGAEAGWLTRTQYWDHGLAVNNAVQRA